MVKIRAVSPKPNVVFIVLESVGSHRLLGDLANTPNIAALARSAVAFENVYAVYPSTARNHLAINTGGFQLTGEGMIEAFQREFTGPLMARGFAAEGYATALFSSERLDVEGMDQFERRAGWGTLYDFGRDVKNHVAANILNSWCAKEEFTMTQIEPWLEAHRAGPFLLSYMNGATHHPYSVPRGFREPNGRADDLARYRNALHYTDAAIGQLVAMLKARRLFENTLIAITGDHGQAFGEHPGNFVHKNAIYEENIRTFLLLSHPALGAHIPSSGGCAMESGNSSKPCATAKPSCMTSLPILRSKRISQPRTRRWWRSFLVNASAGISAHRRSVWRGFRGRRRRVGSRRWKVECARRRPWTAAAGCRSPKALPLSSAHH